jgi:hypothetical protein
MKNELKIEGEKAKVVKELLETGAALKEAAAEMSIRSYRANLKAWELIKQIFPKVDFDKHKYSFNSHTCVVTRIEETEDVIIKY